MAEKQLITEQLPVIQDVMDLEYELVEDKDPDTNTTKAYRLKGVFQRADVKNGNGRVYPRHVLEREVYRLQPLIAEKRVLGELDHPADAKVHLDKVSHLITKLEMKPDGVVYGEATVLETPAGKVLKELLKSGVKLGISSRGYGTVRKNNGVDEVTEDYKMVTFDIVSDPSTPNAFPEAVYEHKETDDSDNEEDKAPLSLVVEDVLDDMLENVKIDLDSREYIGLVDGIRFYLVEGALDSYGTLKNHISHYYHLELKDGEEVKKIGLNEDNLKSIKENFGNSIFYKIMKKIGYKGFVPETLIKARTDFAKNLE